MPRDRLNQIHGVVLDMVAENDPGPAPMFTVETDLGYPIVLCVFNQAEPNMPPAYVWYQLWVLESGQTLSDPPFEKFRIGRQRHTTQINLPSAWGGSVFRRFDETHLEEVLAWLNDHEGNWSVRACAVPPRVGDRNSRNYLHRDGDTVPFEFSFENLVTATEFKLRWG